MDAGQHGYADEHEREREHLAHQFPLPTIPSPPESSISSLHSEDSIVAHVHPPTPDMDEFADGYRRRKAALVGDEDRRSHAKPDSKPNSRRHRQSNLDGSDDGASGNNGVYFSDDGHSSDFSSLPTSEDVELQHYPSEGRISDNEETSLAKKDEQRRKRKRARTAAVNDGPLGSIKTAKQEQELADKNVVRALIINALLIASWYLFSVSISVVGYDEIFLLHRSSAKQTSSITDGCSRRAILTSTFLSSQPACIWSFNFLWLHLYYIFCRTFALDQTA